ncbi:MAG TPA: LacI family DNA-binding transcriptional regulator [Blastocatellia bacterium]|nr:LacI family DNA-binding transcriptional regulator [Blastocatellia bacterium]
MPVTLADIARELGVSKMTISRAINNHPLINARTRERVLEVARRMNYQPNQHARALATNRSYLIGVVVPDLMNSYFAEVTRAIESVARPAGFQILICSTDGDAGRELGEVEALLHRTDGLIISSVLPPAETKAYRKMIKEGARIVLVDRAMSNVRCSVVATDNSEVGRLATEHLIRLGHRRIGHLRGDASSVSAERLEGYKQSLAKHRLRYDESLVRDCGLMESEGYEAMRAWLSKGDAPGAIFAVNDATAIGAMQAMHEAGIKLGRDAALVGAGNIHYGDMLRVPLTTVSWSRNEMGRQAARLLVQLIEGKSQTSKAQRITLPPELIVRGSCGAKPVSKTGVKSAARLAG